MEGAMKRFMYLSISVLCLSVSALIGSHIGTRSAQAQAPGPIYSDTGIVTHFAEWMLDQYGQTWFIGSSWERTAPDVPSWLFNQIKSWHLTVIITQDNSAWKWNGTEWVNLGPWPGGPVPTSPNTWGDVKGKYDDND
jgi:hypothetical protein